MASEVELERMVVRVTGDTSGLQKAYAQAGKESKDLAAKVGGVAGKGLKMPVPDTGSLDKAGQAMDAVHLKSRGLYMGMSQLSRVTGIPPEVSHSAMVLSRALPALGGYAAPILGVVAPLAAVGVGVHMWYQEWNKAREAANNAFQQVGTGARTAQQAISDMRVSLLTEGFKQLMDIANPSLRQYVQTGLQQAYRPSTIRGLFDHMMGNRTPQEIAASMSDPVAEGTRRIEANINRATRMMVEMNNNPALRRVQGNLVTEIIGQQAKDQAATMEDQANAAGATGLALNQYLQAARLARAQNADGIVTAEGLAAAYDRLAEAFSRQTAAARSQALTDFRTGPLRNAQNQAQAAGLGADAAQRLGFAQQFAAQNFMSVNKALRLLNPQLMQMAELQDRAAHRTFDATQVRQLEEEADRAGLSENASRRLGLAQQYAFDRGISLGEALDRLTGSLGRMQDAQNRASVGNFMRDVRMQGATMGLSSERARLFQMSLDGVSDANITAALAEVRHLEALRALQAGLEETQGVLSGSTAALQNVAQYENRFTAATQAATIRQRLFQDQQLNQASPGGFGALAGSTAAAQASLQSQVALGLSPSQLPGGPLFAQQVEQQVAQVGGAAQPGGGLPGGPIFAQQVGPGGSGAPVGDFAAQMAAAIQQGMQQQAAAQQQAFGPVATLLTQLGNWLQANQPAPVVGGGGP